MSGLSFIVNLLNAAPFNCNLTLSSFSEKTPNELLQLAGDMFSKISNKFQGIKVSDESSMASGAARLIEFLKTVKYKTKIDEDLLMDKMLAGEKDVIYNIFEWALPQSKQLSKQADIGYYLTCPEIPEDMIHEEGIYAICDELSAYQKQFIELHKESERIKSDTRDPQKLKLKVHQAEEEKAKLLKLIKRAAVKADCSKNTELYSNCTLFQKQQEEKNYLESQVVHQQEALQISIQEEKRLARRLQELQTGLYPVRCEQVMKSLEEEASSQREKINHEYPKVKHERENQISLLQEVLSGASAGEAEAQRLERKVDQLNEDIQQMEHHQVLRERQRAGDPVMLQIRQAQKIYAMVQKKNSEIVAREKRLQEKRDELDCPFPASQFASVEAENSTLEGQWRAVQEKLKQELPRYKTMREDVANYEAELLVLSQTEEILEQQVTAMRSKAEKMGLLAVVDQSDAQSTVEDLPEDITPEKLTKMLSDANAKLKERKSQLAPKIRELRGSRTKFQELETEHAEAKRNYDSIMVDLQYSINQLETQVRDNTTNIGQAQQEFHLLNCLMNKLDNDVRRFTGTDAAEIKDKYISATREVEVQSKKINSKLRNIEDKEEYCRDQKNMFTGLKKLLELKLNLYHGLSQSQSVDMGGTGQSFETRKGNVFVL